VNAEAVNIYFLDERRPGEASLWCPRQENFKSSDDPYSMDIHIDMGKHIVGRCAAEQQTLTLVHDSAADVDTLDPSLLPPEPTPGENSPASKSSATVTATREVLCAPLMVTRGKVVGVVQAINKRQFEPRREIFDEFDKQLLSEFGRLTAPIVQRKKRQAMQRRALAESDDHLHGMLDSYSKSRTKTKHRKKGQKSLKRLLKRHLTELDSELASMKLPSLFDCGQWGFATLDLELAQMTALASQMWSAGGLLNVDSGLAIKPQTFRNFVQALFGRYRETPYHNAWHGFSVFQSCYWFCNETEAGQTFSMVSKSTAHL
jgi:hypothetical protein